MRGAVSKVMWVGRATVFLVGLAVIVGLLLGLASAAFGANGDFFKVGKSNFASAVSTLAKSGAGPALSLKVGHGKPLAVNSSTKVTNLNSDKIDGKGSNQIGVNGLVGVLASSANNSASPKSVSVYCPSGKVVVGGFYNITGGKTGSSPNQQTDVVIDSILSSNTSVSVDAFEEEPTSASWDVIAIARCARAP